MDNKSRVYNASSNHGAFAGQHYVKMSEDFKVRFALNMNSNIFFNKKYDIKGLHLEAIFSCVFIGVLSCPSWECGVE